MAYQLTAGKFSAQTDAGDPASGFKLYTYASGTTTPQATYTDATLGSANTNPVILNARGEASVWMGTAAYTFALKTAGDVVVWSVDGVVSPSSAASSLVADLASTTSGKGADLIGLNGSTETVGGTLRRIRMVTAYGTVGDGTTNDQTAVASAVAAAYAAGDDLYWPDGTYSTTATIPNLHNIRHFGPGVIKRGASLFYPGSIAGKTNTIYLSTTGSDSNDGLSASEPRLTTQAAVNILYTYPQGVDVQWVFQYAAGTYTESAGFIFPIEFPRFVQLLGAPVADGTQPTTIIQSAATSSDCLGFQGGHRFYVEDIWYKNASATGAAGLSAYIGCNIVTRNVWADNCYAGIFFQSNSVIRIRAGKITNCTYGVFGVSNCTYTVGYQGTAADIGGATGTSITGCQIGVNVQENCAGHVDYTYIGTCTNVGMEVAAESRVHLVACNFQSNTQNLRARGGNNVNDNPAFPTTWGSVSSLIDRQYLAASFETNTTAAQAQGYNHGIGSDPTAAVATTAATATSKTIYTFPTWMLYNRGSGFRAVAFGDVVGVTGTKVIEFKLGGVSIGTKTILAASVDWKAEVEIHVRNATNDISAAFTCTETSAVTKFDYIPITTVNLTSGATALTVEITSNGTDTMRLRHANVALWTA